MWLLAIGNWLFIGLGIIQFTNHISDSPEPSAYSQKSLRLCVKSDADCYPIRFIPHNESFMLIKNGLARMCYDEAALFCVKEVHSPLCMPTLP